MTFYTSKVYTALNAHELKVGSKVFCGNNLKELKQRVMNRRVAEVEKLVTVRGEDKEHRFVTARNKDWLLAYLIEEPDEENKR